MGNEVCDYDWGHVNAVAKVIKKSKTTVKSAIKISVSATALSFKIGRSLQK